MKAYGLPGRVVLAGVALLCPAWAEDVLVIEQDYNLVRSDKEGVEAKDIRQRMFISRNMVRIDEFGGESKQPTESFLIDLKQRLIVNLDHGDMTKLVETFEQRAARIELRKQKVLGDLQALDGPQKEKVEKLYRALLDDERSFEMVQDKDKVDVNGVECRRIRIVDRKNPDYEPMVLALHPKKEMPYDSAEVLYLLQIVGGNMREFLNQNKAKLKQVPMAMTVDLAAGGTLKVKVVNLEETTTDKLDPALFLIPDYKDRSPRPPRKERKVDGGQ